MKLRNRGSLHPSSALDRLFEHGGPRGLPRRDCPPIRTTIPSDMVRTVQYRGYPFGLKNDFDLFELANIFLFGIPKTSIMQANWSLSFSPGNNACPDSSSAKIQPNDHMSMALPYFAPKITSGAR